MRKKCIFSDPKKRNEAKSDREGGRKNTERENGRKTESEKH